MTHIDDNSEVSPVPVLIVDDQLPFRRAAHMVLRATPGFEAVGEAVTGEEAIEQFATLDPAMVLMDINLPGISGIEATRRILAGNPDVVIVLLSTYREDDLPADAKTCGAAAYVNKENFEPSVLIDTWAARRGE